MLLQFKFKNFRSFKEEAEISMMATNIHEHESSLIEVNGSKVLPLAAVFGANASGKSNVFCAFFAMAVDIVCRFDKDELHDNIVPYAFCTKANQRPTEFEVCIQIDGREYRYGFARDEKQVYEEWLYEKKFSKNVTKEKCVFRRMNLNGKKAVLKSEVNEREKREIEFTYSMTSREELLINNLGKRAISKYSCVYNWFNAAVTVQDFSNDYDESVTRGISSELIYEEEELRDIVVEFLNQIDDAIRDIKVEKEKDNQLRDIYEVYFLHECEHGEDVWLPLLQESSGTRKMFSIATHILISLKMGKVLFMDEFDAKLHPLALRYILRMYQDRKTNTGNGQLIFSSHNLVCLDSSDLRRDEIWFVEKENQQSSLYSLYDFKEDDVLIRSDLNFGKHYLNGRFGAVPFQD
jgi:hypothetical protein